MKLQVGKLCDLNGSNMGKLFLYGALLLLILSIIFATASFFPVDATGTQSSFIIDDSFTLTPNETYRQGLGSFHGGENISISISSNGSGTFNFTLLTYGGPHYINSTNTGISYNFTTGADYYEAIFAANTTTTTNIQFQVSVQKAAVVYPFSWIATPAKVLFFSSAGVIVAILMLNHGGNTVSPPNSTSAMSFLSQKDRRRLQAILVVSLVFWFVLLAANTYQFATFENWYTDHARNPYSAQLFTKVGFSIFDTPLGKLSSNDFSFFKFVTWAEMPHLYPLGSVFLFLPFGWLLENGIAQTLVFKLEIALFLVVSHVCMYYFLKRFWTHNINFDFLKRPLKKDTGLVLKTVAVYLLYIVLVIYSANGMFDTVAFLFTLAAVAMFLEKRFDLFLLFGAISLTFKYQAGIFLLPLVLVSIVRLLQQNKPSILIRNKGVLAAVGLAAVNLFTAYLSFPFFAGAKPEFTMNGVNAFSPHAQISWMLQAFAVLLTLGVTLVCAVYLLNRSRIVSLFMVFSLLPCFTMPYFQSWYLPFFFVYLLFPKEKRALEVSVIWVVFMTLVLSFGGLSYNPMQLLDSIRRLLGI